MADNPFESFFLGLQGGFAAGKERRMLVDLAERGDPVEVPGITETFLQGMQLSRTMPTTPNEQTSRQAAEAQVALGFLNANIRQNELLERRANQMLASGIKLQEQRQDLADAELLANEAVRLTDFLRVKDFGGLEAAVPPEGLSTRGFEKWQKTKSDLLETETIKLAKEVRATRDLFESEMRVPAPEGMTVPEMRAEIQRMAGVRQVAGLREALGDENVTSITQSISGTGNVSTQATISPRKDKVSGLSDSTLSSTFLSNQRKIAELEGKLQGALLPQDKARAQTEIDGLRQQQQFLAEEARLRPGVSLPEIDVLQTIPGTASREELLRGFTDRIFEDAIRIRSRNEQR